MFGLLIMVHAASILCRCFHSTTLGLLRHVVTRELSAYSSLEVWNKFIREVFFVIVGP